MTKMIKEKISSFFKDLFTEPDNETWCIIKILTGMGALTFVGASIYHVVINHTFDAMSFGTGFGSMLAGGGGSMLMKKDTPIQ
jgi:hypothetical protein